MYSRTFGVHYITRGHSLMVKFQPSKLAMRVRFPLPAHLPMKSRGKIECQSYQWCYKVITRPLISAVIRQCLSIGVCSALTDCASQIENNVGTLLGHELTHEIDRFGLCPYCLALVRVARFDGYRNDSISTRYRTSRRRG